MLLSIWWLWSRFKLTWSTWDLLPTGYMNPIEVGSCGHLIQVMVLSISVHILELMDLVMKTKVVAVKAVSIVLCQLDQLVNRSFIGLGVSLVFVPPIIAFHQNLLMDFAILDILQLFESFIERVEDMVVQFVDWNTCHSGLL